MNRILYVEDEPDIREVAVVALEVVGGFEVHTADSGMKALQIVGQIRPEIILLDVMMPGMDGPTTLRELRKIPAHAGTPVIFMTAKVQPREIETFLQMGALGVIAKPFDPMRLPDQIRDLLRDHGVPSSPEQAGRR